MHLRKPHCAGQRGQRGVFLTSRQRFWPGVSLFLTAAGGRSPYSAWDSVTGVTAGENVLRLPATMCFHGVWTKPGGRVMAEMSRWLNAISGVPLCRGFGYQLHCGQLSLGGLARCVGCSTGSELTYKKPKRSGLAWRTGQLAVDTPMKDARFSFLLPDGGAAYDCTTASETVIAWRYPD